MVTVAPPQALGIIRTPPERAREVSETQVRMMLDVLNGLTPGDWRRDTACEGWTVRDVVAHVVGQFEELPRPWLMIARVRRAHHQYPHLETLDGRNRCQVDDRRSVPPAELTALLDRFARQGLHAMERVPVPVRQKMRLSPVFPEAKELPEDSMDYLVRVLVPRDTWMHRVDICDATGQEPVLGTDDREIVGQVLHDLATAWSGPTTRLDLTGPAGGRWSLGNRTPVVTVHADAVTLMRHLSGRAPRGPIDCEGGPAAAGAVRAARVVF